MKDPKDRRPREHAAASRGKTPGDEHIKPPAGDHIVIWERDGQYTRGLSVTGARSTWLDLSIFESSQAQRAQVFAH